MTETDGIQFERIAPTVAQPGEHEDYQIPWQELTRRVGVYGPNDPRARILGALGFETPVPVAELAGARFSAETSGEQIGLLDADVLGDLDPRSRCA
ncbi:MAG: hypothetical protein ACRD0K_22990 [Egibacteraceae bacterium]